MKDRIKTFLQRLWGWRQCNLHRARLAYPKDHFNYRSFEKHEGCLYFAYERVFVLRGDWWIEKFKEDDVQGN